MKRRWLITLLLFIVVPVTAVLLHCWPRPVPLEECSEVYRRYADTDGVRATYIKDYRVNDTLTVDVTLLQATDSTSWEFLCSSFNCHPVGISIENMKNDLDALQLLHGNKRHDCGMTDSEIGVASFLGEYICIFHNFDSTYKKIFIDTICDKMFKSLKYKHNFIENEKDI